MTQQFMTDSRHKFAVQKKPIPHAAVSTAEQLHARPSAVASNHPTFWRDFSTVPAYGRQVEASERIAETFDSGDIDHGFAAAIPLSGRAEVDSIQLRAVPGSTRDQSDRHEPMIHAIAQRGISGPGSRLPYFDTVQRAFGYHDLSSVVAHTDQNAKDASRAMGAVAYATGNHVAFGETPSLHTVAHETAHVVQQRRGVDLKAGVGEVGDCYERDADLAADLAVQGNSTESLTDMDHRSTKLSVFSSNNTLGNKISVQLKRGREKPGNPQKSVKTKVHKKRETPAHAEQYTLHRDLPEVEVFAERPPIVYQNQSLYVCVAIWDAQIVDAKGELSPGHVAIFDKQMRVFLSQFPTPHGLSGINTTKTYDQTIEAEGRSPTAIFLVKIPKPCDFDLECKNQRLRNTWSSIPLKQNETNCSTSSSDALNAGGLEIPFSIDDSWIGDILSNPLDFLLNFVATPTKMLNSMMELSKNVNSGVIYIETFDRFSKKLTNPASSNLPIKNSLVCHDAYQNEQILSVPQYNFAPGYNIDRDKNDKSISIIDPKLNKFIDKFLENLGIIDEYRKMLLLTSTGIERSAKVLEILNYTKFVYDVSQAENDKKIMSLCVKFGIDFALTKINVIFALAYHLSPIIESTDDYSRVRLGDLRINAKKISDKYAPCDKWELKFNDEYQIIVKEIEYHENKLYPEKLRNGSPELNFEQSK